MTTPSKADAVKLAREMLDGLEGDGIAKLLFEACRRERLLNTILMWDRTEGSEEYGGSTWKTVTHGLSEAEKAKWRRVAALLCRAILAMADAPDPINQALNEGDGVYRP